ncbi:hypothetical protein COT47_03090 [Candidatus Woesearchaeota archaeon CG08_land_8_20_14_0_20_43_7]|nr:MAG: hypothetical protein COT47_03090 [Candidatus Woesearchaeota archaeon CG08_land_8_20_14_0_20_43_7]
MLSYPPDDLSNLIGDGVHNFVDGVIIAAAFLTSFHVGLITTLAIALHEIPQEIGDFAVLIHGGLKARKALWLNFLSSLTAVAGAIIGYLFLNTIEGITPYILAIAAGGFIYIATADLLPELHKECEKKKIYLQTAALLFGVLVIYFFLHIFSHGH